MSRAVPTESSQNVFKQQLNEYKQLIDDDIAEYCAEVAGQTKQTYGTPSLLVSDTFSDILQRDCKRLRGTLAMVGYEMCGGTNQTMIIHAARAVEMIHAYILIIDDIQDRGALRRGGPSAHKLLESAHVLEKWKGEPVHNGMSLAINAALLGLHRAEMLLANLDVSDELRVKAINIMNHTMAVTVHGQTHDIINEITSEKVTVSEIENVLQWKTAHYSFLNPIHMGMVLAGAPCEDTNAIIEYALHTGKAFQIIDDLKVLSQTGESGKTASDDIREGKQTLLTEYALRHATPDNAAFLASCLGNQALCEDEFQRCKDILIGSGAIVNAKKAAANHIDAARGSLKQYAKRWTPETVQFLDDLAQYLIKQVS